MKPPLVASLVSLSPFALLLVQQTAQQPPKAEEVYKDIQVFKGLPADEIIPAMEFMSASLGWECKDCHTPNDYAATTQAKETARDMVRLQRSINDQFFEGRNAVTCMTCHLEEEHPADTPFPAGTSLQHKNLNGAPEPAAVFAAHIEAAGDAPAMVVRKGTLTGPNDATGEIETRPLTLAWAQGGKFRLDSGDRLVISDGTQAVYFDTPLTGEPLEIFTRMSRSYLGEDAFAGLVSTFVNGQAVVDGKETIVVRGHRPAINSFEELYFDRESGLLQRLVNVRTSTLGQVVSRTDYDEYAKSGGIWLPMKVTTTFPGGTMWTMDFDQAQTYEQVDESLFEIGSQDQRVYTLGHGR